MATVAVSTHERTLARVRAELKSKLSDYEACGLERLAQETRHELSHIEAQLVDLRNSRQREERERWSSEAVTKAGHEARAREMRELGERREAASTWLEKRFAWGGGRPLEAVDLLRDASRAGHRAEDVLALVTRVRRLRDGHECLAKPGSFLMRDFDPIGRSE